MRNGGPRIMADDNPVARINSQIFQSRDIKGCKLHFWSNAPGGYTVQQFQPGLGEGEQGGGEGRDRWGRLERGVGGGVERAILSLVECENRDNRFINQIKSMIE